MISLFDIKCTGFTDPETLGIATYNYYYFATQDDGTRKKFSLASTSQADLPAILPVGTFELRVQIWDTLEAYTDFFIQNITTMMPTEEMVESFNASDKLQQYSDLGDTTSLAMFITALNSVDDHANWTSLDSSALGNKTQEELDDLLLSLNDKTSQQLSSLEHSSASSINEINVFVGVLNSAVAGVLQNDMASYTLDMDAREKTLNILEEIADGVSSVNIASPEQYKPYLASALDTMTALMKGMNTILENGDIAPPGDKEKVELMEYDGDISEDPDLVIPDTIDEMYTRYALVSTKRQCRQHVMRMSRIVDKSSSDVQKKLVKGEVTTARGISGAWIIIGKFGEETLEDGMLLFTPEDRNASVFLPPEFCPSKYIDPFSDCRREFGLTLVVWPVITHFYSKTSTYLAKRTSIIDIRITSEATPVVVTNAPNPITIEIPRYSDEMLPASKVNVSDLMNPVIPLVYHLFNFSTPRTAYFIEITPTVPSEPLVIIIGHEQYPLPGRYLHSYALENLPIKNGTRTLFVSSLANNNRTGKFVAGVGKLLNDANHINFTRDDLDTNFDSNYEFRVILSGCYFFNDSNELWEGNAGLEVVAANTTHTRCTTTHLTQFGSGFLPTINSLDFNYIIINMGFTNNTYLYASLIIIFTVYLCMMIWAHYKDRKDIERRGAVPLPDNKLEDKYIYEVTFHTGPDSDAPCESNISFIASGDYAETEILNLPPANLNLYRRYDRNTFVMTTHVPLGYIHYLRVFHDNSGRMPYDSWQLERVVIRDLQNLNQYIFETNAWLALNRGDGEIDRTFLCSNNTEDTSDFSGKMYLMNNRGTNQDHMWLSMFLRPIGSRFSRKERVTVCAVFLYVSMMISTMFYVVTGDASVDSIAYLGPIPLPAIYTAFIVLVIAYPLAIGLSVIFKRARPQNLKRCRALNAIEAQRKSQLITTGKDPTIAEDQCKLEIEENMSPRVKVEPVVKCLPWWTRTLAWFIAIGAICASAFMVIAYGITWGEVTTVKWFTSFFTTFLVSLIVSQWIKVVVYSCCASLCFKVDLAIEDMDCDEELPHLKEDEEWLNMKSLDPSAIRKVHRIGGVNSSKRDIRNLSKLLIKQREMRFVVRGVIMYCFFLFIVFMIVNDRTDFNAYLMQSHMKNTFIKPGHLKLDVEEKVRNRIKECLFENLTTVILLSPTTCKYAIIHQLY